LQCNPDIPEIWTEAGKNRRSQTYCHAVHIIEIHGIYINLQSNIKFSVEKTKVGPATDLAKESQQQ
jgi:hypothetical protein